MSFIKVLATLSRNWVTFSLLSVKRGLQRTHLRFFEARAKKPVVWMFSLFQSGTRQKIVRMLLTRTLERKGNRALSIPIATIAEMLSRVAVLKPGVVCISALPPFAVDHARPLYTKLRTQPPDLHIVICMCYSEGATARIKLTNGHAFFTTLSQVLLHIASE
jgi:hypothetical protein